LLRIALKFLRIWLRVWLPTLEACSPAVFPPPQAAAAPMYENTVSAEIAKNFPEFMITSHDYLNSEDRGFSETQ